MAATGAADVSSYVEAGNCARCHAAIDGRFEEKDKFSDWTG
jgi:hypothetical protein